VNSHVRNATHLNSYLAQRVDDLEVLGTHAATVPALSGPTHELRRAANSLPPLIQPQLAAAFLDIVLVLFTLCLGAAILLESPELSGGLGAYLLVACVMSLYPALFQGLPVILGLAPAVRRFLSGCSGFMGLSWYPGVLNE
jgi:hypothetical protein